MTTQPQNYSDYIVFADESGDHGLVNINRQFPVFALAFCVVKVGDYVSSVVPEIQRLKFSTWGHDAVIFHEHDIRRGEGDFSDLRADPARRRAFIEGMNDNIAQAPIRIVSSVIDKNLLVQEYCVPFNPYEIALRFCMERLLTRLLNQNQLNKLVHVIFESRGKREDGELELEFRRICSNYGRWGYRSPDFTLMEFRPVFVSKSANSIGLQLANLVARPIALSVLRPHQNNRAYDIIEPKIWDMKTFP